MDTAIASTLKHHLFERASVPDASTADLALLARFVHRNEKLKLEVERVQISHQRLAQNNRRLDLIERTTVVREKTLDLRRQESEHRRAAQSDNSKLNVKNSKLSAQSDDLGPYATNWDEISERARIAHGVSPEEWARRQALHDTYVDPNPDLNNPNPNLCPSSTQPSGLSTQHLSSSPSVLSVTPWLNPSSDLSSTVNTYNIRRAEEYWTWRRHIESLPNGEPVPNFITQHRHCPCGQGNAATPCPDHENETFGQFPDWFWTISPHLSPYAQCLTARNLPYRSPNECIPSEFLL